MKITHEVYSDVQVGGSGNPFGYCAAVPEYKGGYVDAIVTCKRMFDQPEQAFYIEGTLEAVRDLALQLERYCDSVDAAMRMMFDEQKARATAQ